MTEMREVSQVSARFLQRSTLARLLNIWLRGLTLVSKFFLIFFLARFLVPGELGLYGLLVAAVSYSLYLLGFDFYTYSTRELLARDRDEWGQVLKSQIALSALLYLVMLPLLLLAFVADLLPWRLCGWFFILLVLEHLNQEIFRLFVAISQPLRASILLCLRSGLWAVAVVLAMFLSTEFRHLEALFGAWVVGGLVALILGLVWLRGVGIGGWGNHVHWRWIRQGLKVAIPLLIATLALRGLSTFDRYWFEYLLGLDALGAYVLFAGICAALIGFLDAGVFSFIYPGLIKAWQRKDYITFSMQMRKMLGQTVVLAFGFCIVCIIAINPLLAWLGKAVYLESLDLFPWVLGAAVFYALGLVPHYGLYAQGRDAPIIYSHLAGLAAFVTFCFGFSLLTPRLAVPIGTLAAFIVILCWKTLCFYHTTPVRFRS